jgi:hypothetical protein
MAMRAPATAMVAAALLPLLAAVSACAAEPYRIDVSVGLTGGGAFVSRPTGLPLE